MTSLQLPVSVNMVAPLRVPEECKEWGTGKLKREFTLWLPKSPTWHVTGKQEKSKYGLTKLKLSNVRLSDQLLSNPEHSKMSGIMINQAFPAEHPNASHQSKFAVFPNFESADDPRTGTAARCQLPKDAEMPSKSWDVGVIKKVKGNPYRHEVQKILPESKKQPLVWLSSDHTDQLVKSPWSEKQTFYPTTPKTYLASMPDRTDDKCLIGNMKVSQRSANIMRNVQKDHRATIYQRSYTGLGESHKMNLDNLTNQKMRKLQTGYDDYELKPVEVAVFDPSRSLDGRLEVTIEPKPLQNADIYNHPEPEKTFGRSLTAKEKGEHHLWYGKLYSSLPEGYATPRDGIIRFTPVPVTPSTYPYAPPTDSSQDSHKVEQHDRYQQHQAKQQQMHAENRYKILEAQKPAHDIASLRRKMTLAAGDLEKPTTFYSHESKYQRERAGLYRTSYLPEKLSAKLDPKRSSDLIQTISTPVTKLTNVEDLRMDRAMTSVGHHGRTLAGSVPQYRDLPTATDVILPWKDCVNAQKDCIQPNIYNADIRTQEGVIIHKDTTYGGDYNTKPFLQERQLLDRCRDEPVIVMSHQNRTLANVVEPTLVREDLPKPQSVPEPRAGEEGYVNRMMYRPYTAPEKMLGVPMELTHEPRPNASIVATTRQAQRSSLPVALHPENTTFRGPPQKKDVKEEFTLIRNKDTTIARQKESERLQRDWKFGIHRFDYSAKDDDPRFKFCAGEGIPQPSCNLQQCYDGFSRSDLSRHHHGQHPEHNPDLRDNRVQGKRHMFNGVHLQVHR